MEAQTQWSPLTWMICTVVSSVHLACGILARVLVIPLLQPIRPVCLDGRRCASEGLDDGMEGLDGRRCASEGLDNGRRGMEGLDGRRCASEGLDDGRRGMEGLNGGRLAGGGSHEWGVL